MAALGRDDEPVAEAGRLEPRADRLFADAPRAGRPVGVDVRRIDKRATRGNKGVEQRDRRHGQIGPRQAHVFHGFVPFA